MSVRQIKPLENRFASRLWKTREAGNGPTEIATEVTARLRPLVDDSVPTLEAARFDGEWEFCPGGLDWFDDFQGLASGDNPEPKVCGLEDRLDLPGFNRLPDDPTAPSSDETLTGNRSESNSPQFLTNVFDLHSKANARHKIFLDFNGHTTANTLWNDNYNNGKSFTTPAFTMDGSSSFNTEERETILNIWRRIAEDFRPFDVDVTTDTPATHELIKAGTSDKRWGIRVVIGGSGNQWLGQNTAGIAFFDSFNFSSDTPAYIFTEDFFINDKNVAEATTHEVGHTLGLKHDGRNNPPEEYYAGHGSGDTGWAPLMGVGYYQTLTQWSKGQYDSASNTEDDLKILTTQNGFGYRDDDHGNGTSDATVLKLSNNHFIGGGVIARNNDVDYFSLGIQTSGQYQLNVLPFFKGPNLDLRVRLYDDAGNLMRSMNPGDQLGVTSRLTLLTGQYYLAVDGVGKSGPDGYTGYGSLGNYSIRTLPIDIEVVVPTIQIYQHSAAKAEGNTGITKFTFRLIRQGNLKIESRVDWVVAGSANYNSVDRFDFQNNQFASGTATFEFGSHVTFISVPVQTDRVWEPHERMRVLLSNPFNGTITKNSVVGTIYNDDAWGASGLVLPDAGDDGSGLAPDNPVSLEMDSGSVPASMSGRGSLLSVAGDFPGDGDGGASAFASISDSPNLMTVDSEPSSWLAMG